jgi:hypothetical protein
MVIVRQTTHGAYILAEMDSTISKLRFAAFCVIPYHARRRMNIDLETFFVFPDADEEMEDVEDETETGEDIQETAGLEEEVPSDDECKGNLTNLRRELHLSLAKGNPK